MLHNHQNNNTEPTTSQRPGLIWARVSTPHQAEKETSIPDQIAHAQALAEQNNVRVDHVLSTVWTAEELPNNPDYQQTLQIIRNTPGITVIVNDRDRLPIGQDGLDRLFFLYELREVGGNLLVCYGPPYVPDDEMGYVIEMILTIAKRFVNRRNQQGAYDGLKARAEKRGLPTTNRPPDGYDFKQTDGALHLVPNARYEVPKLIIDLSLQGKSQTYIRHELEHRGITTSTGQPNWYNATIRQYQHQPVYGGRYYSRATEAVAPRKRKSNTYGKSSQRRLSLEEAVYQSHIVVEQPMMTWEEREALLERLTKAPQNSRRNAKQVYRYGGHIFCGKHTGKTGRPQPLQGTSRNGTQAYVCPNAGCHYIRADGPDGLNQYLDDAIRAWLTAKDLDGQLFDQAGIGTETRENLVAEQKRLDSDRQNTINALANLEAERLLGKHADEVYHKVKGQLDTKLAWITERTEAITADLDQLVEVEQVKLSLREVIKAYRDRIPNLNDVEMRELLDLLNAEFHIPENVSINKREVKKINHPDPGVSLDILYGQMVVCLKIPVSGTTADRQVKSIVGNSPWIAPRNRHFPVRLTLSHLITQLATVEGGASC